MTLADLDIPKEIMEGDQLLQALDECLFNGFSRLGQTGKDCMEEVRVVFEGTPLEAMISETMDKFASGNFGEEGFTALAAARMALLGAQYDALAAEVEKKVGVRWLETPDALLKDGKPNIYTSVQSWLAEIGIRGLGQIDLESITAFRATLDALLPEPTAIRLSTLLTGFVNEMEAVLPLSSKNILPKRRWADLWSRSMISTCRQPEPMTRCTVSGELLLLGTDIREQGHGVRLRIYGILLREDDCRCVCINRFAFKVPSITGQEIWKLFDAYPILLSAVSGWRRIRIKEMALTEESNLIWDEAAADPGTAVSPFETAAEYLPCPQAKIAALDRHPVHLAVPILLEGYDFTQKENDLRMGGGFPVTFHGTGTTSPLTSSALNKGEACISLLRFDGGRWELQPLAVRSKGRNSQIIHNGVDVTVKASGKAAAKKKRQDDALSILRERAGKLLRK